MTDSRAGRTTGRTTVGVALAPPLADEVTAWAEAEAGWDIVGPDGPPTPRLVLADRPRRDRPTVVVCDGAVDAETVRGALDGGALDVVAWPDERERLLAAPARVTAGVAARPVPTVRVTGLAGGTGASTVAMALGGVLAWSGRRVVVVGGEGTGVLAGLATWRGPGAAEVAALAGDAAAEVDALAVAVPGVPRLRLLGGLPRGAAPPATGGWPADVVVVDMGVVDVSAGAPADPGEPGTELWVGPPDARLVAARGVAGPLVVVGERPLPPRQAARVAGREPTVVLSWSARVTAAALRGRVPADLPGRWLQRLRAGVAAVTRNAGAPPAAARADTPRGGPR